MQELPPDAQGSPKEGASSYTLKQPGKAAKIQVLPRPYFAAEALLMQSKEGSCPRQSAGHTAMQQLAAYRFMHTKAEVPHVLCEARADPAPEEGQSRRRRNELAQ